MGPSLSKLPGEKLFSAAKLGKYGTSNKDLEFFENLYKNVMKGVGVEESMLKAEDIVSILQGTVKIDFYGPDPTTYYASKLSLFLLATMYFSANRLDETNPFKARTCAFISGATFIMLTTLYHSIAKVDPEFNIATKNGPETDNLMNIISGKPGKSKAALKSTKGTQVYKQSLTNVATRISLHTKSAISSRMDLSTLRSTGYAKSSERGTVALTPQQAIDEFWKHINNKLSVLQFDPDAKVEAEPLLAMVSLLRPFEKLGEDSALIANKFYNNASVSLKDKLFPTKRDYDDNHDEAGRLSARYTEFYAMEVPKNPTERSAVLRDCEERIAQFGAAATSILSKYQELVSSHEAAAHVPVISYDPETFKEVDLITEDIQIEWYKCLKQVEAPLPLMVNHFLLPWSLKKFLCEQTQLNNDVYEAIFEKFGFDLSHADILGLGEFGDMNDRFVEFETCIVRKMISAKAGVNKT